MPALGNYEAVVITMHKFINGTEGNRDNKNAFDGFDCDETNILFVENFLYVKDNLSTADLVSIGTYLVLVTNLIACLIIFLIIFEVV